MSVYVWLRFLHLVGLATFLISHGVSAGASLALRGPVTSSSRGLLRLSQLSGVVAFPALLLLLVTGVWMGFAGHWWGKGWIWAAIAVFVALTVAMGFIAGGYHHARGVASSSDEVLRERLSQTRPVAAIWIGTIGLLALLFLMVFKPF
ncbi:MAG: hypothetical protein M3R21_04720 [Candidatus Dormibacteraeota bacterium]|nr:hypothetical protein [Candidatus Dormibacteraeota bacterium]